MNVPLLLPSDETKDGLRDLVTHFYGLDSEWP